MTASVLIFIFMSKGDSCSGSLLFPFSVVFFSLFLSSVSFFKVLFPPVSRTSSSTAKFS